MQNPETKIGFLTFDRTLHFYKLPQDPNGDPTILFVGDTTQPFSPLPLSALMLAIQEDKEKIDSFLDKLLTMHPEEDKKNLPHGICSGSALEAARGLLQEEEARGGKIHLFATNLSTVGVHPMKSRDDQKLYNTADEKKILNADPNALFGDFVGSCLKSAIGVDLYFAVTKPKPLDLATYAYLSQQTGGKLTYFPFFDPAKDGEILFNNLYRNLSKA